MEETNYDRKNRLIISTFNETESTGVTIPLMPSSYVDDKKEAVVTNSEPGTGQLRRVR